MGKSIMARYIKNTNKNKNQIPLFETPSNWVTPTELPYEIFNAPVIAIDTETKDPDLTTKGPSWFRGGFEVVGISLAWSNKEIYLPIGHHGGGNMDRDNVIGFLRELLQKFTGTLVLAHAFYDLGALKMLGIDIDYTRITVRDVQMIEALIDEHKMRYNLDSIATTYGLANKDERLLREAAANYGVDPKSEMYLLHAKFVGSYASRDASLTLEAYYKQLIQVQLQSLERVIVLEHDLLPLLLEMRWRGVRVDVAKAEELYDRFMKQEREYVAMIQSLTGRPIDIWSADSCAVACDAVGVVYKQTSSGKNSFEDEWLSNHPHQVPQLISKARKQYKAANSFCKGMVLDHADKNGYVHASFNPLRSDDGGTVSGRFSSSAPNLQQVPARDPEMNNLIRGLFLPEEGELWCAADYSQQEPRLTVHYAVVNGCRNAQEAADQYNENPDTDYHQMVADFAGIGRKPAKTINLGLAYGMGGAKLARSLGLPVVWKENSYNGRKYEAAGPEAQAVLDKYNNAVPFIKQLSKIYMGQADDEGFITTLSGRRCRFPYYEPRNGGRALLYKEAGAQFGFDNIKRAFTYSALNRKIQGGSADMIKIALRNLYREGYIPKVTVHDENGLSVKSPTEARHIAEIMRDCVQLKVPLKVDVDIGSSWGAAKPMTEDDL
jgi:DNA polymerase I-like protein with 3'-5' exonuclease and polymerase domains